MCESQSIYVFSISEVWIKNKSSGVSESFTCKRELDWIPAYAGMTGKRRNDRKTQE